MAAALVGLSLLPSCDSPEFSSHDAAVFRHDGPAAAVDRSPDAPPPLLRVCSWNIEGLSESNTDKDFPRVAHVIDTLCDVVAVQEVKSRTVMAHLAGELNKAKVAWQHSTSPTKFAAEYYGVLSRSARVTCDANRWRCPANVPKTPSGASLRPVCALPCRAGTLNFWLEVIHIRWSDNDRCGNVSQLPAELDALLGKDPNQKRVLVGDFNCDPNKTSGTKAWDALLATTAKRTRATPKSQTNLAGSGPSTHLSSSYDHIVISDALKPHWTKAAGVTMPPVAGVPDIATWNADLSDHLLVWITLKSN